MNSLKIPVGRNVPTADQHNRLLDWLRRQQLLSSIDSIGAVRSFPHPWRVRASRFDGADLATLNPASTWRIDVAPGVINDQVPTILYARAGDPRGWVPPPDYVLPQPGELSYDARWIERDLLDDPDDAPFLAISDPPVRNAETSEGEWRFIPEHLRPGIEQGAFCGEADWELELWRAHVLLSAVPFRANYFAAQLPPPRIVRYRLFTTPRRPAPTYGASAGGWLELATLYLLRDPASPETAELKVRQREWWPLWASIVQPGRELVSLFDAAAQGVIAPPGFTDILRGDLQDTLQGAMTAEFWTV